MIASGAPALQSLLSFDPVFSSPAMGLIHNNNSILLLFPILLLQGNASHPEVADYVVPPRDPMFVVYMDRPAYPSSSYRLII